MKLFIIYGFVKGILNQNCTEIDGWILKLNSELVFTNQKKGNTKRLKVLFDETEIILILLYLRKQHIKEGHYKKEISAKLKFK